MQGIDRPTATRTGSPHHHRPGRPRLAASLAALGLSLLVAACARSRNPHADLALIYNRPARDIGVERTPVVVIPGILGSKLKAEGDDRLVWGAFTYKAAITADADKPGPRRLIALPMRQGAALHELTDDVAAAGVLDTLEVDTALFVRGLQFAAYRDILATLGTGKYLDPELAGSPDSPLFYGGDIDYGNAHFTCYQYGYDWRRDISEQAAHLDEQIGAAQDAVRNARKLPPGTPVKVDVVAHSMGGLVLRYYLRYGAVRLPDDGSLPPLTWGGAANVRRAVLVATPSAGSPLSLDQLIDGWALKPITPHYRASILGSFPAVYQLLPRVRHARVVDESGAAINLYDPAVWRRYGWGLADPDEDSVLQDLLPDVASKDERRAIALDHLAKCLARAEQLHRALDVPATIPAGTTIHLFVGDSEKTTSRLRVDDRGRLHVDERSPGDGTVARDSALMDERLGGQWSPGLKSPEAWTSVHFIAEDHLGLTRSAEFSDNLLFLLLEAPE